MSEPELLDAVHAAFGASCVKGVSRHPSPYATSHALDDVEVQLTDGRLIRLVLKDPADDALLPAARSTRPAFLRDPERERLVYQRLLQGEDGPPRLLASGPPGRSWLLLEKVPGVELYQVGEVELWAAAARWLARFHARHVGGAARRGPDAARLIVHDGAYHARWRSRAAERRELLPLLPAYDRATQTLERLPVTVVHGEFHASNILVSRSSPPRVAALDWESAALASGPVDLADLVTGWESGTRDALLDAYWSQTGPSSGIRNREELGVAVAHARVVAAIRLLTWAPGWQPPPEHVRDWVAEAEQAAAESGG